MSAAVTDPRFVPDDHFPGESEAESSTNLAVREHNDEGDEEFLTEEEQLEEGEGAEDSDEGFGDGMLAEGFSGPSEKVVKPLEPEDLAKFQAAQERTGVVYISRIPPGMRPTKVRHLMSQYGAIGRVYLQAEGA